MTQFGFLTHTDRRFITPAPRASCCRRNGACPGSGTKSRRFARPPRMERALPHSRRTPMRGGRARHLFRYMAADDTDEHEPVRRDVVERNRACVSLFESAQQLKKAEGVDHTT